LHEIHSVVGKTPSYGRIRKEQVVLTRCRICHCRFAHSYLLNNEERRECIIVIPIIHLFTATCLNPLMLLMFVRHSTMLTMSHLFINVAGETNKNKLIELNLYTKI